MIETHTIRLRGPWQCDIGGGLRRIHMPVRCAAIVSDDYDGRLLCRRRFGCPTCLDPHERVWLVIDQPARPGEAALNGAQLGILQIAAAATEFDITDRLRERNELELAFDFSRRETVAAASAATGWSSDGRMPDANELLFRDVRLEIRG